MFLLLLLQSFFRQTFILLCVLFLGYASSGSHIAGGHPSNSNHAKTLGTLTASNDETASLTSDSSTNKYKETTLNTLLKVFGMEDHAKMKNRHMVPPQYMLDLYKSIADGKSGITRAPNPYNANIVRSFSDKGRREHLHFFFNISNNIPKDEKILEGELHVYKLRPKGKGEVNQIRGDPRSHLLEVRVYQLLSSKATQHQNGNKRLLDSRRMSLNSVGWEVFYVKDAVLDWAKDESRNFGLLITVKSMLNEKIDSSYFRFVRRHSHHTNKQPILVVFSGDGRQKETPLPVAKSRLDLEKYGYPQVLSEDGFSRLELETKDPENNPNSRHKRNMRSLVDQSQASIMFNTAKSYFQLPPSSNQSLASFHAEPITAATTTSNQPDSSSTACTRHELYVDFETIGWSAWIISPKGYHAYYCKGDCSFPLGQDQWPTNHATVQSVVHKLNLTPGVEKPCCVPNRLSSITLLYFDDQGNVILKQHDDMVAVSCACH